MSSLPAHRNLQLSKTAQSLRGTVESILFCAEDKSFAVIRIELEPSSSEQTKGSLNKTGKESPKEDAGKTFHEEACLAGALGQVQVGETIVAEGNWQQHPQYGRRFRVERFETVLPATLHGLRRYLAAGLIPGIGPDLAKRIVKHFGEETMQVLEEDSGRLQEVAGIGTTRAKAIKQAWDEQGAQRRVLLFLARIGAGKGLSRRLLKAYGGQVEAVLTQEPYRAVQEVKGLGFHTADRLARQAGLPMDSPARAEAGLRHVLQELEDEGHTAAPVEFLQEKTTQLLSLPEDRITQAIISLLQQRAVVESESGLLQASEASRMEEILAEEVARLASSPVRFPPIKVDVALRWAQERMGFAFAPEQADAIRMGLTRKFAILTGGPGTGKTTILRALCEIVRAKQVRVVLAAPTGRAAQRLAESTGLPASTIHRLLHFDPEKGRFTVNRENPLNADLLVVDEVSMLDARLGAALFRAIPQATSVLLVGDADQLPSVGAGNVLRDLILSQCLPIVSLRQVFRQKAGGGIAALAHDILRGRGSLPDPVTVEQIDPHAEVQFIDAVDPHACREAVVKLTSAVLPQRLSLDPWKDAQVLVPMHRGPVGVEAINHALQAALNDRNDPDRRGEEPPQFMSGSNSLRLGDKVIQLRNQYEKGVFNGDLGCITEIGGSEGAVTVRFESGEVPYAVDDLSDLALAYAMTVHKSQGSEFPAVILPLSRGHAVLLQRNLLYTALTRARRHCFLVGDPSAWRMGVQRAETSRRWTTLMERLRNKMAKGGMPI